MCAYFFLAHGEINGKSDERTEVRTSVWVYVIDGVNDRRKDRRAGERLFGVHGFVCIWRGRWESCLYVSLSLFVSIGHGETRPSLSKTSPPAPLLGPSFPSLCTTLRKCVCVCVFLFFKFVRISIRMNGLTDGNVGGTAARVNVLVRISSDMGWCSRAAEGGLVLMG